jgi:hypothetical protein
LWTSERLSNFRTAAGGGVLSAAVDADDTHNYAPNTLAGFNVNTRKPKP